MLCIDEWNTQKYTACRVIKKKKNLTQTRLHVHIGKQYKKNATKSNDVKVFKIQKSGYLDFW